MINWCLWWLLKYPRPTWIPWVEPQSTYDGPSKDVIDALQQSLWDEQCLGILRIGKTGLGEAECLASAHPGGKEQSWDLNMDPPDPRALLLATMVSTHWVFPNSAGALANIFPHNHFVNIWGLVLERTKKVKVVNEVGGQDIWILTPAFWAPVLWH